jgi:hypothetical protein
MPFQRPTRQQLIDRDAEDLAASLPGFAAQAPRSLSPAGGVRRRR